MTPNEYQQLAARTLIDELPRKYTSLETFLTWNALGLAGEAGEVVDCLKKMIYHDHGISYSELEKELGDVLWYIAALCSKLGLSLETVMERNIEKLKERYPDGFSCEQSLSSYLERTKENA